MGWDFLVVQILKTLPAIQERWVWSLGGEDPLEKEMATHSSILAWRIPWKRSLVGYSPRGCKESDMTEWLTLVLHFIYVVYVIYIFFIHLSVDGHLPCFLSLGYSELPYKAHEGADISLRLWFLSFGEHMSGLIFNPLQYSCLENSMDRGAWRTIVRGIAKSWIPLSNWPHSTHYNITAEA